MYAIKHVIGIMELSDSNMYVEDGAECIEVPDGTFFKEGHCYDIIDGKLVDMSPSIDYTVESPSEDLG